jgi:hypothetical protein
MKRKTLELRQVQALCEIINGRQTLILSIADAFTSKICTNESKALLT